MELPIQVDVRAGVEARVSLRLAEGWSWHCCTRNFRRAGPTTPSPRMDKGWGLQRGLEVTQLTPRNTFYKICSGAELRQRQRANFGGRGLRPFGRKLGLPF
jgi:hypothetical protein